MAVASEARSKLPSDCQAENQFNSIQFSSIQFSSIQLSSVQFSSVLSKGQETEAGEGWVECGAGAAGGREGGRRPS